MSTLLEMKNLTIRFGGVVALDAVSFSVPERGIVGLIGPNGAGKTTALNCISRYYSPGDGDVLLEGRSLLGLRSHQLIQRGVARTFQQLELFPSLSALDNLLVAQHHMYRSSWFSQALGLPHARREEATFKDRARGMLRSLDLEEYEDYPAAALSFGVRKRLDLCRALLTKPRLLLMDEPAAGITAQEMSTLGGLIRRIRDEHQTAVLLVEHHMHLVMETCEHLVVLNFGKKLTEGPPAKVAADPQVVEAYLGTPGRARAQPGDAGRHA